MSPRPCPPVVRAPAGNSEPLTATSPSGKLIMRGRLIVDLNNPDRANCDYVEEGPGEIYGCIRPGGHSNDHILYVAR